MRASHEGDQPARMKTVCLVRHAEERHTSQRRPIQWRKHTEPRAGIQHTTARGSTIRQPTGIGREARDTICTRGPQLTTPGSRLGNIQSGWPVHSARKGTGISPTDTGWHRPGTLPTPPSLILSRIVIRPNETAVTGSLKTRRWWPLIGGSPRVPILRLRDAHHQNAECQPPRPGGQRLACRPHAEDRAALQHRGIHDCHGRPTGACPGSRPPITRGPIPRETLPWPADALPSSSAWLHAAFPFPP